MIQQGITDPMFLMELLWPDARYYDKQLEVIESVRDADTTVVHAGNMLGKDWVTGYIALSFFICPQVYFDPEYVAEVESTRSKSNPNPHTVRVITTSVKDDHLRVLWGEIGRFVGSAVHPLTADKGGPLIVNHRDIRIKRGVWKTGVGIPNGYFKREQCPISYLRGMVSEKGEGMAGHHAAYTLFVGDEASGIDDLVWTQADTWAKRRLAIGNPNPCNNFFRKAVDAGDLLSKI